MLQSPKNALGVRIVLACTWTTMSFACAHGVDSPLVGLSAGEGGTAGGSGEPVVTGSGGGSPDGSSNGGAGGNAGVMASTGPAGAAGSGGGGGDAGSRSSTGSAGSGVGAGPKDDAGNGGDASSPGTRDSAGIATDALDGGQDGGDADGSAPRPTSINVGQVQMSTGQMTSTTTTGTSFNQSCAANEVLIGFRGTVEAPGGATTWLRSFQAVCGSLSIAGGPTYLISTVQTTILAEQGTRQSVAQTRMCPANQVIIGFGARSGGWIDQLTFSCASLVVGGRSPTYTLAIGMPTVLQTLGGPNGSLSGTFQCSAGQIAVGDDGRDDAAISAFGLRCARPTLIVE